MKNMPGNPAVSNKIPTIIHQIWIQGRAALPEAYKKASTTWQKNNPDWNHILWDDQTLREFMAAEAPEWLRLYDLQKEMEAKADVARYALLLTKGGLYADMDTECVRPISKMMEHSEASLFLQVHDYPWTAVSIPPGQDTALANSVIASAPAHPFWEQVRADIERNPWSWLVPARTGPWMLSPLAKGYAEYHAQDVCFWNHRRILTASYLPRICMRCYSFVRRKICVLDFNDSGRAGLVRELRRPHHLIAAIAKDIAKDILSRRSKRSQPL